MKQKALLILLAAMLLLPVWPGSAAAERSEPVSDRMAAIESGASVEHPAQPFDGLLLSEAPASASAAPETAPETGGSLLHESPWFWIGICAVAVVIVVLAAVFSRRKEKNAR